MAAIAGQARAAGAGSEELDTAVSQLAETVTDRAAALAKDEQVVEAERAGVPGRSPRGGAGDTGESGHGSRAGVLPRLVDVDPRPEQVQLPRPGRARPHLEEQRLLAVGRGLAEAAAQLIRKPGTPAGSGGSWRANLLRPGWRPSGGRRGRSGAGGGRTWAQDAASR
ncbi:hypothetical protein NQP46_08490 [Streptomyces albus]|nr:hypothetical protein NQP46_08490 [Streptomyces albus]